QDPRQPANGLVWRGCVDEVAVPVHSEARPPHQHRVAERVAPFRSVAQARVGATVLDDRWQVLPREQDPGAGPRAAVPYPDVEAASRLRDERRQSRLHRLQQPAVGEEPATPVLVLEAAVEGRKQRAATRGWDLGGSSSARRLLEARVERDPRAPWVDPGNACNHAWIARVR